MKRIGVTYILHYRPISKVSKGVLGGNSKVVKLRTRDHGPGDPNWLCQWV